MKTGDFKVLIIGAGIGGLTTALALAQNGVHVEIFEKAAKFSDVGAGLQLSPNANAVLSSLGLSKEIEAICCEPRAGILRDYKSGKALLTTKMKDVYEQRYGHKYLHIHRADLIDCLAKAAQEAGVKTHLGSEISSVKEMETGVQIENNGKVYDGGVLIAADGVRSSLREKIAGKSSPVFTGQVAWRGLVPTSDLSPDKIPFAANNWLGPGQHFVSYYVCGGEMINFVAVQERADWVEESWDIPADMGELQNAFTGWDPRVTSLIEACGSAYLWGLFDHPPLETWTTERMALLGDAAHPMLPFMAQGAAMAIEDAWVLTRCLTQNTSSISQALQGYEAVRKPRTTELQMISRNNAALYHQSSTIGRALRKAKFKIATKIPAIAFSRLDKIYGVDVTKNFPI
ncbi:FAD-dependent monooxygenase [Litorimonas haliclonae]|uniref:FAD-dependent monooxygenase n=1 Tax=Litorimonas haliclonae TaxID=2081977 RepID=UPI0039F0E7E4